MNKKLILATALLLTFSILSNLSAQGWLQRYGTNSDRTSAQAVARTADNGYIFCGYSDGGTQLYIVKTDPEGGVLATRKYKTADDVQDVVKMVDAGDGTFLIAFATKNTPTNTKNISLYKIRPNGDTVWTKQFGDTNNERIGDIKRLADGNFIIVGTKFTTNGDSTAILKTDPQGQQLFFTTPQFINKKFATAIAESQNRSILYISFRPNGASDTARLVKLDANGTNPREVKIKAFGTNNDKFFSRIDALSVLADGNLAILGDYFAKVDTNGTVLWANIFVEFNASPKAFTQDKDGNFAVVGTFDETRQVSRPYFLKINGTNGTTIAPPKQIGFIDNVAASSFPFHNAIIPTTDGGFILASEEIAGGSRARLMKLGTTGKIWTNEISGRVFVDNNNNCQQDGDDKPFLNAIVEAVNRFDPSRVFRTRVVDSFGYYTIALDSGTYDLRLRGVPPMWSACTDNISFNTDFEYKQAQRSFGLRPTTVLCPQLDVNVSTPFIRACSTSVYRVRYCNNGSATAQNTYVTLQLDSLLNFQNATIPAQLVGKRLFRFNIGSVEVGKCGGFDVRISPDCGTAVKEGQTLCVKATIYPNAPCFTSPNWSGASLKVEAVCDADSLRVLVQNIGTPSSGGSSISSIVVTDEVVFRRVPINTNTGVPQALPTLDINNGYTYRVSVPQVPNHPGNSRPTIAVEGCRKNSTAPFSLGKVNQFPEDDFDPFVDKECQILRGSTVNNELTALPVGYQNLHKIEPTDEIEYQINFRNRSTDTAFTVAVRDTLSPFLDPASVELGASSHPYRFQMFGENLMKFTFENIKLPPSGLADRDEAAGFVKFRVKLKTTIPNNTRILNAANISTNFGTDVITNETFHTVGQNFVLTATIDPPTSANLRIKVYPNPFSDKAIFEIEGKNIPLSKRSDFSLYDATGRLVRSDKLIDGRLEFERQNLPVGLYVFKIENDGKLIGSGKLMIKN